MTAALWTGTRAWMPGATLYLPEAWLTPEAAPARHRSRARVRFQEKWRLAFTLLRQIRASGFQLTAVVGDAEFGDNATLRRTLHRTNLPYALGVSSDLKVFPGTPRLEAPAPLIGLGRPRTRRVLAPGEQTFTVAALITAQPTRAWRQVSWRNGTNAPWRASFLRVACDAGARLASSPTRPRGLGARRTRLGRDAAHRSITSSICRPRRRCTRSCTWRINDGRSSSSIRN